MMCKKCKGTGKIMFHTFDAGFAEEVICNCPSCFGGWLSTRAAFQQSLHPTSETLPAQEALSTPEHSATSQN
jgi:hypothetical protein